MMKPGQPVMALQRLHTRRYTNAVIRQLKHNLLRESSEGFSALIIVLTDHATHKRSAAETWAKSESIMGYFNLSPTRVLDVLLDVFACSFEHEWVYWLDVLKCTPWGLDAPWKGSKGKGRAIAEDVAQLDTDKIEPFILKEAGHRVLAEVLGFKFAEYQVSHIKLKGLLTCQREESSETTSMGLVYVAALLIKEGFVKSLDLLPFVFIFPRLAQSTDPSAYSRREAACRHRYEVHGRYPRQGG
jgi:THO complex subunit 2